MVTLRVKAYGVMVLVLLLRLFVCLGTMGSTLKLLIKVRRLIKLNLGFKKSNIIFLKPLASTYFLFYSIKTHFKYVKIRLLGNIDNNYI